MQEAELAMGILNCQKGSVPFSHLVIPINYLNESPSSIDSKINYLNVKRMPYPLGSIDASECGVG